ncbi:BACON domain-containing protein [Pedobacter heparinus]|uniref:BACON domain-containing protein n=1 Tax=Pedobacter heparinus (strain ATCC 13125 / DSM 2366 / CIP 104194 / JCM 7457 / NBRC 12017 / NCIMB 9290 / NRRL B-14731 / HIM 762-3) TaxID=485917 RepID=C6XUV7_PEDHD|nr:BACON domain-containing protein [Pedobacter heparinus]ACU05965.1 hypothetical protein Phep_3774 [Pedobacter heparinus DSM 2366]
MKYPNYLCLFLLLALNTCFYSCSKNEDEPFLKRNLDELSFNYFEESKEFTIRATGDWSIDIPAGNEWIKVEPSSGTGDGKSYQKIKVTCLQNISEKREGTIYLNGAGQANVPLKVRQNNGLFEWYKYPNGKYLALTGTLIAQQNSNLQIKIPYRKAIGNESFPVQVSLTGKGAAGLQFNGNQGTITDRGDGYLYLPVSGTPTTQGELLIQVKVNNQDFGTIQTITANGTTLVQQNFAKFLWGGDCIGNKDGVTSTKAIAEMSLADETILCVVGTNGANGSGVTSTIRTSNPTLYKEMGLENWLGVRNYMRPGYLQLGATSATATEFGSIITPGLALGAGETKDILVTFKVAFYNAPFPSSVLVGLFPKSVLGVNIANLNLLTNKESIPLEMNTLTWVEVSCVIKNATNASSLAILLPESTNQAGTVQASRLYIDDIIVTY